jgi:hypothetical protein
MHCSCVAAGASNVCQLRALICWTGSSTLQQAASQLGLLFCMAHAVFRIATGSQSCLRVQIYAQGRQGLQGPRVYKGLQAPACYSLSLRTAQTLTRIHSTNHTHLWHSSMTRQATSCAGHTPLLRSCSSSCKAATARGQQGRGTTHQSLCWKTMLCCPDTQLTTAGRNTQRSSWLQQL